MKSPAEMTHCVMQRHATRMTRPASRFICLVTGGMALFACVMPPMANAAQSSRFELTGSGTLVLDQPVQKGGSVQLKATLVPADVASPALPNGQAGGGFALNASLATASTACYNDTIFRDDFDGDGL